MGNKKLVAPLAIAMMLAVVNIITDMLKLTNQPTDKPGDKNIANSTVKVLRDEVQFLSSDLDKDMFSNQQVFVPVGVVHNFAWQCDFYKTSMDANDEWLLSRIGLRTRSDEFFMEMGFILFFQEIYNYTFHLNETNDEIYFDENGRHNLSSARTADLLPQHSRLFLPFCPLFDTGQFTVLQKIIMVAGDKSVENLQTKVGQKRIFYVNAHPGGFPHWENLIHNTRAMRIDQTSGGSLGDIYLPISTTKEYCPASLPFNPSRPNVLYSCGKEHSVRYKGLRSNLPQLFNALNHSDIDMSIHRSKDEYDAGFAKSKFCVIIPGDTSATSQSSKAMCSGCVPIYILSDFRELPFSNVLEYDAFSLRIQSSDVIKKGFAENLYNDINELVKNGTYAKLRSNVEIARDFFNYHRFGSRSPYGAALISMYQDEKQELQRN
jgi:hypothetical protein